MAGVDGLATTTPAGFATRWAGGDPAQARAALMMLLTLRGTPFLYYGDEIGMHRRRRSTRPTRSTRCRAAPAPTRSRDACRTPMHVDAASPAPASPRPASSRGCRSATPRPTSRPSATTPARRCTSTRDLIALRRGDAELRARRLRVAAGSPEGVWAWRRGDGHAVALNLSGAEATVEGLEGTVAIATDRARDGEAVGGALTLAPWQGAVVKLR